MMESLEKRFNAAKVSVRFIKNHGSHQRGETAGFPYSDAMALVNGGVAVYRTTPPGFDEFGLADETDDESDASDAES